MAVDSKVKTISGLARWIVDNIGARNIKISDPFKVGIWNWYLSIENLLIDRFQYLCIRLFPETSRASKEQPPVAKFVLRVSKTGANGILNSSPIHEKLFRTGDDFVWAIDCTFVGRFIIDVKFLDLKICSINGGGDATSIWPSDGTMQSLTAQTTFQCLSRMLNEAIHADVTINASDGTLRAHKAILCARSPVFERMFLHDFKEKESSIIDIEDMSQEAFVTLLRYLYGIIRQEDFWKHRLALLGAANKYDIADLKDSCEESLLEDLNSGNVLGRLQEAWLYQLEKLKKGCFTYLFDFGKIYDVKDEINDFIRQADSELFLEMFQAVLATWKPA